MAKRWKDRYQHDLGEQVPDLPAQIPVPVPVQLSLPVQLSHPLMDDLEDTPDDSPPKAPHIPEAQEVGRFATAVATACVQIYQLSVVTAPLSSAPLLGGDGGTCSWQLLGPRGFNRRLTGRAGH